jgi:hypothetical protein
MDRAVAYFKHKIEESSFIDVEPLKLIPPREITRGEPRG